MARSLKKMGLLFATCLFPTLVFAQVTINGFVSAGGGTADGDIVDAGGNIDGYDDDWTFSADNILGIQISSPLGDNLSATGQIVADGLTEGEGDEKYDAEVSWAYISYTFNDQVTGRVGRFRAPLYLYSDYLDVGYAYHWIRPPGEVYSLPFSSVDGIDVVYNSFLGDWDSTVQVYAGSVDDGTDDNEFEMRNFVGVAWTLGYDWLTLRASYHEADLTFIDLNEQFETLATGLDAVFGAGAGDDFNITEEHFYFIEFAAKAEVGDLLFVSEYTSLNADSGPLSEESESWYASVAYRFGAFTPHFTYSETNNDPFPVTSGLPTGVNDGLLATANATAEGVAANGDGETSILGVRWDFAPSAAFKLEYHDVEANEVDGDLINFVFDIVF